MESVGEMQGHQIPAMRRLIATVQQHDGRIGWVAPFEQVQSEVIDHRVTRDIANLVGVRDAKIGGRCAERGELFGLSQINSVGGWSEGVQVWHWQGFSDCSAGSVAVYRGR